MNRDYHNINIYLDILMADDYGQEPDKGHTQMAKEVVDNWLIRMTPDLSILDVGCGSTAFLSDLLAETNIKYTGVALSLDANKAKALGKNVFEMDMSFLEFPDESFSLIFARHVLEHSPMPILTLMEWYRVSGQWLCVIVPTSEGYGWGGQQHYSVMHPTQLEFLLDRAGWHIIWTDFSEKTELRYMCEKKRKSHYDLYMEGTK